AAPEENRFIGSLYRRRIHRRLVPRDRKRPPVLYPRTADPRRRSGGLTSHSVHSRASGNPAAIINQQVSPWVRALRGNERKIWLIRMQPRNQFIDMACEALPIVKPIARKAEGDIGIVDATLKQAYARVGDALARAARQEMLGLIRFKDEIVAVVGRVV